MEHMELNPMQTIILKSHSWAVRVYPYISALLLLETTILCRKNKNGGQNQDLTCIFSPSTSASSTLNEVLLETCLKGLYIVCIYLLCLSFSPFPYLPHWLVWRPYTQFCWERVPSLQTTYQTYHGILPTYRTKYYHIFIFIYYYIIWRGFI